MAEKYILREKSSWRIKIRLKKNVYINKSIHFDKYGGIREALKTAIKIRDQYLKQHDQFDRLNYKKSPDFYKSDKTRPCIGVFLERHYQANGNLFYNWTVRYSVKGKEIKKHFSVSKYGYENAFLMACELRYKYCGPIRVINKKKLPCKLPMPYIIISA